MKICKKLHEFDGARCEVCHRARSAAYRIANPSKVKAAKAAWMKANSAKAKATRAAWVKANPEKCKAAILAWQKANSEKVKASRAARYAANPEKTKAVNSAWATANPEKVKGIYAAYRAANREKANLASAACRAANPEKARAASANWKKAHPDADARHHHARRARKLGNGGVLSKGLFNKLFILQKGKCACCHIDLTKAKANLDHITPLVLGGPNTDNNIQLLCKLCNQSKHAKHPIDFMQSRGFLL